MTKKAQHGAREIRLVIADDHLVVREGLRALICSDRGMKVLGEAANGKDAVREFFTHRPDVLLLDLRMPDMSGPDAIRAIRARAPEARVIVLSTYGLDEDIYRVFKAGAKAYLLKDSGREHLLKTIRAVASGETTIPPEIGARLAARMAAPGLSNRESAVLELVVAGKSNKEIAALLGLTEGTVKVHLGNIFKKLGAAGRTEAIRVALDRGLVHLSPV